MSSFVEKLVALLRIVGAYVLDALKAIGRFLKWFFTTLIQLLSNFISWTRTNLSPRARTILLAFVAAILIVVVALIVTGHGCTSCSSDTTDEEALEATEPPSVTYTPNEADVRTITSAKTNIESFSLVQSGNQMYATLSEEELESINNSLAIYQSKNDDVGFLIVNLNTGSGFCYNIDTAIYGASTYKAPLSMFICEQYIDTEEINKSAVSTRIENAIIYSDNNSYRSLKHAFDGEKQVSWLSSMGINPSAYSSTFPTYSVRDSATIWIHGWNYLNSGSETAKWLKSLLNKTERSFLRNGANQAGMNEAEIYNKAGWCVSQSGQQDSVNDAGIVVEGENAYLVVAFSSTPDSATAEANLANLFEAILQVRHNLDATQATWDNVTVAQESSEDAQSSETLIEVESVSDNTDAQNTSETLIEVQATSDGSNG